MKRILCTLVLLLCTLLFMVGRASAYATIDFVIGPPTSGYIAYDPAANGIYGLIGRNISVDYFAAWDTGLNDGSEVQLSNGILTFTTGPLLSRSGDNKYWTFDGGPSTEIKVSGSFNLSNKTVTGDLFKAVIDFSDLTVVSPTRFNYVTGSFSNVWVNNDILSYYGQSWGTEGDFKIDFQVNSWGLNTTSFTSKTVTEGSIYTTLAAVPVPPSLLLLGSGMVGLLALGRKGGFCRN